jgi:hypothetical protein
VKASNSLSTRYNFRIKESPIIKVANNTHPCSGVTTSPAVRPAWLLHQSKSRNRTNPRNITQICRDLTNHRTNLSRQFAVRSWQFDTRYHQKYRKLVTCTPHTSHHLTLMNVRCPQHHQRHLFLLRPHGMRLNGCLIDLVPATLRAPRPFLLHVKHILYG